MSTNSKISFHFGLLTILSNFKPKLISQLGEGGQAKVFKATFHGKDVAMKYIPLDKLQDGYEYDVYSYGCYEFYEQDKFSELQLLKTISILSTRIFIFMSHEFLKNPWKTHC